MGVAALPMMAAGVGLSAAGSYNQAAAQKGALNYDAIVNENNAQIAQYQAQVAQTVGARQEQNSRLQTADLYGAQRAGMAANGVALDQGSASDVLTSTRMMGERDALTIRDNTAQRVWEDQQQASNFRARANASRAAASSVNPLLAGASSLLGGAGMVAGSWYQSQHQFSRFVQ